MPPTMQQQIHNLRMAMLRREQSEVGMYDPDEVEAFCIENGAPTLFQAVIDMMTPVCDRRGAESYKKSDARRCAVVILHTLMYCQSQAWNWLQRDTARFYYNHGLSDVGLRATHQMGHAVGMTNFYKDIHGHNKQHRAHITRIIEDAVKKKSTYCYHNRRLHEYSLSTAPKYGKTIEQQPHGHGTDPNFWGLARCTGVSGGKLCRGNWQSTFAKWIQRPHGSAH